MRKGHFKSGHHTKKSHKAEMKRDRTKMKAKMSEPVRGAKSLIEHLSQSKNFLVVWKIDIEAESAEEAAALALEIQRDHESQATFFEVTNKKTKKKTDVNVEPEEVLVDEACPGIPVLELKCMPPQPLSDEQTA